MFKKRKSLTGTERARELLNSKYSFGRITTAEAKSIDYRKINNVSRSKPRD